VLLLLCILGAGGLWAYVHFRLDQVKRVNVAGITPATGGPMNILVVGSDTRANISGSAIQHFGSSQQVQGQRSDVTMVVRIDPSSGHAAVLSIPRDLYVPIPGSGRKDRINSAYNGGPSQLIQTIQQDLGIQINHYVGVDFSGFQGIVDAVGGIKMYFPYPAKDAFSGLNVTSSGCISLNGAQALALARSRDYQYLTDGYWHYDGTGDLGRIQREHVFLRVLMGQAISAGIHNPIKANDIVGQVVHDVTIDQTLDTSDIVSLVLAFRSLQPTQLPTYTIPTTPATVGGAAVLEMQQPQAQQLISQFLATGSQSSSSTTQPSAPEVAPSSVTVQVLNGSGVSGQAATAAGDLRGAGFVVSGTGNASTFHHTQSVILYAPSNLAKAQALRSRLVGGAQLQADSTVAGADVDLVTGSSYQGVSSSAHAPAAPGATPTESQPPAFDPHAC
jgi:LCP family protein required for cell wall assembly